MQTRVPAVHQRRSIQHAKLEHGFFDVKHLYITRPRLLEQFQICTYCQVLSTILSGIGLQMQP
jgi:hypothetical protein